MASWRTWTVAGDAREHTVVVRLDRMRGRAQVWVDARPVIAREFAYSLEVDFPVDGRTAHLEILYKPDLRWLVRVGSEKVAPISTAKPANAASLLANAPPLPPTPVVPFSWTHMLSWMIPFGLTRIAKLDGWIILWLALLSYAVLHNVLGIKRHPMLAAASLLYGYAGWLVYVAWTSGAALVFAPQALVILVLNAWLLTDRSWLPLGVYLLAFGGYTGWFFFAVRDWKAAGTLVLLQGTVAVGALGLMAHGYWTTRRSGDEPTPAPSGAP